MRRTRASRGSFPARSFPRRAAKWWRRSAALSAMSPMSSDRWRTMTRPKMMMARRRRRTRALKHVQRADGGGLGGAPVALDIFDAPLGIAIANNETVRGVVFESVILKIYSRVSPSACGRDEFVRWLTRRAPMFAAMGVPNFDMDDDVAMADECRSREFRRRESSLAEWSSRLDHSESRFACESVNAVRRAGAGAGREQRCVAPGFGRGWDGEWSETAILTTGDSRFDPWQDQYVTKTFQGLVAQWIRRRSTEKLPYCTPIISLSRPKNYSGERTFAHKKVFFFPR